MEIGNYVKGTTESSKQYSITNERMTLGKVLETKGDQIFVKVLKHECKSDIGSKHWVKAEYFEVTDGPVIPREIKEALEKHVLWLEGKEGGTQLIWSELIANLSGADLSDANLSRANLSDANLSDADLSDANLSDADLSDANLSRANLSDANLSGANLSDANLSDADLSDANLSDADLSDANLSRANLSDANLSGANLSGADLSDANLSGANLSGADLSQTKNLLSAINYLEANFDRTEQGYIVYKTFGGQYTSPSDWKIEKDSIIEEVVNPDRSTACGCGVNVAPIKWVKSHYGRLPIWKCLIEWAWLPGVVVPYNTDGKIRCERVRLLEIVEG